MSLRKSRASCRIPSANGPGVRLACMLQNATQRGIQWYANAGKAVLSDDGYQ